MFPLTVAGFALALATAADPSLASSSSSAADTKSGSEAACSAYTLKGPALAHVQLNATTYYPENASISLDSSHGPLVTSSLPAFCRLELVITTNATAGSTATTEVWLPDEWNGRALTLGNGAYAGGGEYCSSLSESQGLTGTAACYTVNYADIGYKAISQACSEQRL